MRALVALLVLGLVSNAQVEGATCSPTLFIEAAAYPTGANARFEAIGDFNGDTIPDVATAGDSPRSVSVLLNDGTGTLEPPLSMPLNDDAVAIAAADLRGNGTTDLVVATYFGIEVFLGHGDGTFDSPVSYDSDTYNTSSIVVGTFDADDTLDVVVGSYSNGPISLLPGAGDGTFGEPVLTTTFWQVGSMTSGEFTGDDHLDLATTGGDTGYVFLHPGVGDGTFAPPSQFIGGPSLRGLTSADFNGDSHPDIAVASTGSVSVLLGNGNGGFEAALLYSAYIHAGSVAAADLDQDGDTDIVAAETPEFYNSSDRISVLRGRGDGTFEPGEPYAAGGTASVATADLDGDQLPDVVTAGRSVFVLVNTPGGSLLAVPESPLVGPYSPNYAEGDWNNDGRRDFAWVEPNLQVALVEGRDGGRFAKVGNLPVPDGVNLQPNGVASGHFFDSGTWDLVVATYGEVYLYRGNGDGTFQEPVSVLTSFNLGYVVVTDVDGRQLDDVVVSQGCCGSVQVLTLLNLGDGTFDPPVPTPFPEDVRSILPAVMTAGFPPPGSLGTMDLVVVTPNNVQVLHGNTGGNFFLQSVTPVSNDASVAVGRFFGGLANDLLVTGGFPGVQLYANDGGGRFPETPVTIALANGGDRLTTGYYDDDVNADFAVLSSGQILVFLGLGDGHFLAPIVLSTDVDPSYLTTTSLAGSQTADIAALGQFGIAAFRNSRLSGRVAPAFLSVVDGSPAVFEARASGYGNLTYQWRKGGVPLADGGPISGVHTPTLTIDPAAFADAGEYDVQVSDACTTATSSLGTLAIEFADVPLSSPFHDDIIAIATAEITGGCGGGDYCPTLNVRRDQMAAFLLKSEHGADYLPPPCSGVFSDVPCPGAFADWIEQLAAEGITGGCGTGVYCPSQPVTRAQMAVFLLKTSEGSGYTPPPATGIFGDVPVGSFAADFIEDLYNRAITGGCSSDPLLYCPGSTVLRQQMATFLVRTFLP